MKSINYCTDLCHFQSSTQSCFYVTLVDFQVSSWSHFISNYTFASGSCYGTKNTNRLEKYTVFSGSTEVFVNSVASNVEDEFFRNAGAGILRGEHSKRSRRNVVSVNTTPSV